MSANYTAAYKCRFWYPYSVAFEDADFSLEMKSFEIGNTEQKARNQSSIRNRAGTTFIYDRGRNYNDVMKLQFNSIQDAERAALIVFLESVQWGSSRLKMRDYKGDEFVVRITEPKIEYIDTGLMDRNNPYADIVLWDFNLEVLNLNDNIDETAEDPPVSSALALHLTDYNDPHNPQVSISLDIADGAKTVESFNARSWKAISWLVVCEKNANRLFALVSFENNCYGTTDATTVSTPTVEILGDTGGVAATIVFTATLSGSGTSQVMSLKATTSVDGYTVRVRRTKL